MAHLKTAGPVHPELLKAWQDRAAKAEAKVSAMARVLLAIEWSGCRGEYPNRCPYCGGAETSDRPFTGHKPTCALDAALREIRQTGGE